MKTIAAAMLFAFALTSARSDELKGQVFIVTKGHQTIKLSLVPVAALDEGQVTKAIQDASDSAAPEKEKLPTVLSALKTAQDEGTKLRARTMKARIAHQIKDRDFFALCSAIRKSDALYIAALNYRIYLYSAQRLFEHLPAPLAETKTDADGNFAINIPAAKPFVIAAATTRQTFNETESYHWLVKVVDSSRPLILANDNMTSNASSDSSLTFAPEASPGSKTSVADIGRQMGEIKDSVTQLTAKK